MPQVAGFDSTEQGTATRYIKEPDAVNAHCCPGCALNSICFRSLGRSQTPFCCVCDTGALPLTKWLVAEKVDNKRWLACAGDKRGVGEKTHSSMVPRYELTPGCSVCLEFKSGFKTRAILMLMLMCYTCKVRTGGFTACTNTSEGILIHHVAFGHAPLYRLAQARTEAAGPTSVSNIR